jgi:hypothetical protein
MIYALFVAAAFLKPAISQGGFSYPHISAGILSNMSDVDWII